MGNKDLQIATTVAKNSNMCITNLYLVHLFLHTSLLNRSILGIKIGVKVSQEAMNADTCETSIHYMYIYYAIRISLIWLHTEVFLTNHQHVYRIFYMCQAHWAAMQEVYYYYHQLKKIHRINSAAHYIAILLTSPLFSVLSPIPKP